MVLSTVRPALLTYTVFFMVLTAYTLCPTVA